MLDTNAQQHQVPWENRYHSSSAWMLQTVWTRGCLLEGRMLNRRFSSMTLVMGVKSISRHHCMSLEKVTENHLIVALRSSLHKGCLVSTYQG